MKKIALLFPGQGAQYIGMGKSLYDRSEVVRDIYREAGEILGYDLAELTHNGDMEELTQTEYAQPAIFTYSYSIYKALNEESNILPYYLCGHSLGEITALTCAGYMRFRDGLRLVQERGKLMQQATGKGFGKMAAINGLNARLVEEECESLSSETEQIVTANYNSSTQVVISGAKTLIEQACENLSKLGASAIELKVSAPFHTAYMKPANDKFSNVLNEIELTAPALPVISNIDAQPYTSKESMREKLSGQMIHSVRWRETIDFLLRQGVNTFLELGPKSSLSKMLKREFAHVNAYSFEDNYDEMTAALKEHETQEKPTLVSRSLAIAVCTRNQNWNEDEYQKGVVEPYRKIQEISARLDEERRGETKEEMQQALAMLSSVFKTKGTSQEEQKERFTQILYETGKRDLFQDFLMKY